jgi:hypothetical protein
MSLRIEPLGACQGRRECRLRLILLLHGPACAVSTLRPRAAAAYQGLKPGNWKGSINGSRAEPILPPILVTGPVDDV